MPLKWNGWQGFLRVASFVLFVAVLPEARALLTAGMLGGIVLGVFLILIRQHSGPPRPGRGTPIVLFPRPVPQVSDYLTRSQLTARTFA